MSEPKPTSLHASCNCVPAAPLLLLASAVLLGFGLWLPALETKKLVVSVSSYSIAGGVRSLFDKGHWPTGLLVFSFSIVFPVVKLLGLGAAWFLPLAPRRRARLVRVLEALGKWSMLDVFVVTILMGTLNLGFPSGAEARSGVYLFGAGVLTSMIAAHLVRRQASSGAPELEPRHVPRRGGLGWLAVGVGLIAGVCYALGLARTLLYTEKWHFWDAEVNVLASVEQLYAGAPVLSVVLAIFVVVQPLVLLLWGLGRWALGGGREGARLRLSGVFRWAMGDVFLLSVLVVATKLGDVFLLEYRPGFTYLALGVLASFAFVVLVSRRERDAPASEHPEL